MLRDFTVQPATGGSPAGKAYTHQFPEHVSLYLGMFFIEHGPISPPGSSVLVLDRTLTILHRHTITITRPIRFHGTHSGTPRKTMGWSLRGSCPRGRGGRERGIRAMHSMYTLSQAS